MKVQILAHRTAMGCAAPNSLESFHKCAEWQVDGLECDVFFGADRHKGIDCSKEELWEVISRHSLKVFFDVKFSPETFWEHLGDFLPNFIPMPLAIADLVEKEIIQPAKERGLCHKIGLVGFMGCADFFRRIKEKEPAITTSLIVTMPWLGRWPWNNFEDYFLFLDSIVIGWKKFNQWVVPPWNLVLPKVLEKAEKAGVSIAGGIANSEEEVDWLLKNNFQAIWTDYPLMAKSILLRR